MTRVASDVEKRAAVDFSQFIEAKATRKPSPDEKDRGISRLGYYAVAGETQGLPFDSFEVRLYEHFYGDNSGSYEIEFFYLDVEQKEINFDLVDGFGVYDNNGHQEFEREDAAGYAGRVVRCLHALDAEGRILPQLKPAGEQ